MLFDFFKKNNNKIVADNYEPLFYTVAYNNIMELFGYDRGNLASYYENNTYIYAPITYIKNAIINKEYGIINKKGEVMEDLNLKFITSELIEKVIVYYLIYGEAFIYKKYSGNILLGLEVLNPSNLKLKEENVYKKNIYKINNKDIELEDKNLIKMLNFKISSSVRGIGIVEMLIPQLKILDILNRYNAENLLNNKSIGWIFKTDTVFEPEARRKLQASLSQVINKSKEEASGIVLKKDEELEIKNERGKSDTFLELRTSCIDDIAAAFGVNKGIIYESQDLSYATLSSYDRSFNLKTLNSFLTKLEVFINKLNIFNGRFVFFNKKAYSSEEIKELHFAGIITTEEARKALGWENEEIKPEKKENKINEQISGILREKLNEKLKSSFFLDKNLQYGTDNYMEEQIKYLEFDFYKSEDKEKIKKELKKVFLNQFDFLISKIKKENWSKNKILEKTDKILNNIIFKENLKTSLDKYLKYQTIKAIKVVKKEFSDNNIADFSNLDEKELENIINEQINTLFLTINNTTIGKIEKFFEKNDDIVGLEEVLYNSIDIRVDTIIRTEFIKSANNIKLELYKKNKEVVNGKIWYTALSDRTCKNCKPLHNKKIGLEDFFYKKGETTKGGLKLNHSNIGHPPLHPKCRCVILADIDI